VSRAWIGIGSNMGDRLEYIRRALGQMDALSDTEFVAVSSVYDTVPVGVTDQPRFLNAVAELSTDIGPVELMRKLLAIEATCGRVRTSVCGPRTLDGAGPQVPGRRGDRAGVRCCARRCGG